MTGEEVDFDGDGRADLVGLSTDGALRVYRGTGTPGAPSVDGGAVIGSGWNIDGDDKSDLIARGSDGTLRAYLNKGTPGAPNVSTTVTIGTGWNTDVGTCLNRPARR
ncbi:VCBS repeat-containing protein [Sphaerisporangium sp. TRM90804]|nr:VCBS repeat-containing protein [Sphaerisporangium sp. TRM90804]